MTEAEIIELATMLGSGYAASGNNVNFSCPNAALGLGHRTNEDRSKSFGVSVARFPHVSVCNCFACGLRGTAQQVFRRLADMGAVPPEAFSHVRACEARDLRSLSGMLQRRRELDGRSDVVCTATVFDLDTFISRCFHDRRGDAYFSKRGVMAHEVETRRLGYDVEQGRVVFPIMRRGGQVVGAVGRGTNTSVVPSHYKYPCMDKSVLYGEEMLNLMQPQVVFVEGPMDVIAVSRVYRNVVALDGLNLTTPQMERILHFCTSVVLLLDGDDPGRKAVGKLGRILSRRILVFVADLPDGTDPDSAGPAVISASLANKRIF